LSFSGELLNIWEERIPERIEVPYCLKSHIKEAVKCVWRICKAELRGAQVRVHRGSSH